MFLGRKRCEIGKWISEIKVQVIEHTHRHTLFCLPILTITCLQPKRTFRIQLHNLKTHTHTHTHTQTRTCAQVRTTWKCVIQKHSFGLCRPSEIYVHIQLRLRALFCHRAWHMEDALHLKGGICSSLKAKNNPIKLHTCYFFITLEQICHHIWIKSLLKLNSAHSL